MKIIHQVKTINFDKQDIPDNSRSDLVKMYSFRVFELDSGYNYLKS